MTQLPATVVGDAYTNSTAWPLLTALVDIDTRMAGHQGEQEAMQEIARRFREQGLRDVVITSFEIPAWFRGTSALTLSHRDQVSDSPHELVALPGTPPGDVEGDLVDVGYGTSEEFHSADVAGNLVVASSGTPDSYDRWLHRREKYDAAVDRGAIGFLFRSHVEGCLPPTGDIGDEDGEGAIPGVGVSRELGSRLVRYCADEQVQTRLSVDCRTESATSGNVSGRLGPDTGREILVTAHHDAHDIAEGAKDNGCGCALVVEVARLLAQVEDELDTAVRFVTFGAEEIGLRGSRHTVESERLDEIVAVINLDGIGDSRDLAVDTHGFPALADLFEEISAEAEIPIEVREQVNIHSDHWPFVRQGVPGVMAYSIGGSDERGWGHTHADTLDKLDKRDLQSLAVPLAASVLTLAEGRLTPEHVEPEIIEHRAEEEGYDI